MRRRGLFGFLAASPLAATGVGASTTPAPAPGQTGAWIGPAGPLAINALVLPPLQIIDQRRDGARPLSVAVDMGVDDRKHIRLIIRNL